MRKVLSIANRFLTAAGFVLVLLGLIFFAVINKAILFDVAGFCGVFFGIFALGVASLGLVEINGLAHSAAVVKRHEEKRQEKGSRLTERKFRIIAVCVLVVSAVLFLLMVGMAFDKTWFQPFLLSPISSGLLIAGGVTVILGSIFAFFLKTGAFKIVVIMATIGALSLGGIVWANVQGYGNFGEEWSVVFSEGECGYQCFRIPSLIVIDKDVQNAKNGTNFAGDILLAMAEGRKNSASDVGDIDLVYKISTDGGESWSKLNVLLSVEGEVGKVGNPTAVFDRDTGLVNLLYMTGTKKNKYRYDTFNVRAKIKGDLSFEFEEPVKVSGVESESSSGDLKGVLKALMVGPGKAVQLDGGRLVAPASMDGFSFAIYSDDHGLTWKRGGKGISGGEREIAAVGDRLVMVSRENADWSTLHTEQYARFVWSDDGGESWSDYAEGKGLKTPFCMSSVASKGDSLFVTLPCDFLTRANLTLARSDDGGETFEMKTLYSGASGYSCIDFDFEGNGFVLAEIGKVNYSETLVLFKLK